VTLREALDSGEWFRRKIWEDAFEPFAFRWINSRLERAPKDDLYNTRISERHFSPFDVLANDWVVVKDWRRQELPRPARTPTGQKGKP
jgi:hypothetical protein